MGTMLLKNDVLINLKLIIESIFAKVLGRIARKIVFKLGGYSTSVMKKDGTTNDKLF
jgi:hypothetical protein